MQLDCLLSATILLTVPTEQDARKFIEANVGKGGWSGVRLISLKKTGSASDMDIDSLSCFIINEL
jgi:hypothetical protein